jgi:hypothetical protein
LITHLSSLSFSSASSFPNIRLKRYAIAQPKSWIADIDSFQ